MRRGIDVQQGRELLDQRPNVFAGRVELRPVGAVCLDRVQQQLHVQRLRIAVNELQQRRAQAGNGDLREVVVPVDGVFLRIEHCRNQRVAGGLVDDESLLEPHRLRPSHPLAPRDQPMIECAHDLVRDALDLKIGSASGWLRVGAPLGSARLMRVVRAGSFLAARQTLGLRDDHPR